MRYRFALPATAALVLAGCLAQPADQRSDTARATISSAPATMAAACPPAPACVVATPATPATVNNSGHRAVHRASHRPAARATAPRTVRIYSSYGRDPHADLAGGPPDRAADGGYRYGALPPVGGWSEAERRAYENRAYDDPRNGGHVSGPRGYRGRAYDDRDGASDRWREEQWEPPEDGSGYYYRHGDPAREPGREGADLGRDRPGRDGLPLASGSGARTLERSSSEWGGGDSQGRRWAGRSSETATSSYEERRESAESGCCAPANRPGAAGFDRHGYLTWPGKVPARP